VNVARGEGESGMSWEVGADMGSAMGETGSLEVAILSGENTGSKTASGGLENSDQDTLAKAGHFK